MVLVWVFGRATLLNKRAFLLFSLSLFFQYSVDGKLLVPEDQKDEKILESYLSLHQDYFKQSCSGGTEQEYWKLEHAFKGDGQYLPVSLNDTLDRQTILKHLPELRKKLVWIDSQIEFLKKLQNFSEHLAATKNLESALDGLLLDKHNHFLEKKPDGKKKIEVESKRRLNDFKLLWEKSIGQLPFLQSYNFPLDHFALRMEYDRWKSSTTEDGRRKSNDVYFYRMVVQDGAQDPDHKRSDKFLRSVIDTITIELRKIETDILSEDLRYDLRTALLLIETQLKRGPKNQLKRFEEWRERTHRSILYYTALVSPKSEVVSGEASGDQVVNKMTRARYVLKDYTLKKQAESYLYWSKQTELMQALFSIETILYNEVGSIDGGEGVERRDVTQIVLNRQDHAFYSSLTAKDSLYGYLKLPSTQKIPDFPWLNLLFKEGEFSFTYFFIPSSVRIYCPDMTRQGRWLRRQNLKIALELLRQPNHSFPAMRYYSRHSMHGRIKMDELWGDYQAIAERPGPLLVDQIQYRKLFNTKKFRFLYDFIDPSGEVFQVLEFSQKTVVYSESSKKFFEWRNPQLFRYFEQVKQVAPLKT